jgi:hypothetical protein
VREDTIGQYLLVTCGLPFSGKSTLSRALARQLGIAHVEVDALHAANGLRAGIDPIERADWIAAYQRGYAELEALLPEGRSVVFDAVSYRRLQRNRVRRVAERLGVPGHRRSRSMSRSTRSRSRLERYRLTRERGERADGELPRGRRWHAVGPNPDEAVIRYSPDEPLARVASSALVRPMLTGATVPA